MLVYMRYDVSVGRTTLLLGKYPRRRAYVPISGSLCYIDPSTLYRDTGDIVGLASDELERIGIEDVKIVKTPTSITVEGREVSLRAGFSLFTDVYYVPDAACIYGADPTTIAEDIAYLYRRLSELDYKGEVSAIATYEVVYSQRFRYRDINITELALELDIGLPIGNIGDIFAAIEEATVTRMAIEPRYSPKHITPNVVYDEYSVGYGYEAERTARITVTKGVMAPVIVYLPDLDSLKAFIDMLVRMSPTPP